MPNRTVKVLPPTDADARRSIHIPTKYTNRDAGTSTTARTAFIQPKERSTTSKIASRNSNRRIPR